MIHRRRLSLLILAVALVSSVACQDSDEPAIDDACRQAVDHVIALESRSTAGSNAEIAAAHEAALRRAVRPAGDGCIEHEARCVLAAADLAAARACATSGASR